MALSAVTFARGGIPLVLGLGLVLGAGAAHAAAGSDPAEQLFNEGVEAARHGDWQQARAGFEAAQSLSARPVILINLAGAQARTGRLLDAVRNYRAVADDTSADAAPFREAAVGVLKTLQPRIPRVRVRAAGLTEGDVVRLDGAPLSRDVLAEPVLVDPGPHTITVTRDGNDRARVTVSLAERETHDVSLLSDQTATTPLGKAQLPRAPAPRATGAVVPLQTGDERTAGDDAPAPAHRSLWGSPWLWTAVAAAAAGAATAAVLLNSRETTPAFAGSVSPGIIHVQ
ncbi:MAG: hypothetical protein ABUS79_16140 [Pseudomonadota bacterium]